MVTEKTARKCPKCGNTGEQVGLRPDRRGGKIYVMMCTTKLCLWYNTTWIYQMTSDGKIPTREPDEKTFPKMDVPDGAVERTLAAIDDSTEEEKEAND